MKIKHLNSFEDDTPLIYFGFFLIQNRIQRVNYMESLIIKTKVAIQVHLILFLSVVWRVTVMNSLTLSKLWYILRVTPLTRWKISVGCALLLFCFCKIISFPLHPEKFGFLARHKVDCWHWFRGY